MRHFSLGRCFAAALPASSDCAKRSHRFLIISQEEKYHNNPLLSGKAFPTMFPGGLPHIFFDHPHTHTTALQKILQNRDIKIAAAHGCSVSFGGWSWGGEVGECVPACALSCGWSHISCFLSDILLRLLNQNGTRTWTARQSRGSLANRRITIPYRPSTRIPPK